METNAFVRPFLEITLKIHQIFALLDVDFEKVLSSDSVGRDQSISAHLKEVAQFIMAKGGFEYCPRQRTTEGRMFEHAADSKILIDHLTELNAPIGVKVLASNLFIKLANEAPADPKNDKEEQQVEDILI